jgi:hypothetical protein
MKAYPPDDERFAKRRTSVNIGRYLATRQEPFPTKVFQVGERQKPDTDLTPIERIRLPDTESCESSRSLTAIYPDHIL